MLQLPYEQLYFVRLQMTKLILIRNFAEADKIALKRKPYRILLKIAAEFTFVCYFNENQRK
jgi:hypothetical protein